MASGVQHCVIGQMPMMQCCRHLAFRNEKTQSRFCIFCQRAGLSRRTTGRPHMGGSLEDNADPAAFPSGQQSSAQSHSQGSRPWRQPYERTGRVSGHNQGGSSRPASASKPAPNGNTPWNGAGPSWEVQAPPPPLATEDTVLAELEAFLARGLAFPFAPSGARVTDGDMDRAPKTPSPGAAIMAPLPPKLWRWRT